MDHVNEGLVRRIKWGRVKISEEEKKLKFGVSTCILGFHDFQASILENAGTCYITVMYWYCPHMHVVILDCLKANWPKFSCLTQSVYLNCNWSLGFHWVWGCTCT